MTGQYVEVGGRRGEGLLRMVGEELANNRTVCL